MWIRDGPSASRQWPLVPPPFPFAGEGDGAGVGVPDGDGDGEGAGDVLGEGDGLGAGALVPVNVLARKSLRPETCDARGMSGFICWAAWAFADPNSSR